MKNVHILSTDKPSRLTKNNLGKFIKLNGLQHQEVNENQNIYITNDEKIKVGDWIIDLMRNEISKVNGLSNKDSYIVLDSGSFADISQCKKIILTTDQDLIKDEVQAIDDEFLEWFVKNPSCEEVEVYEVEGKLFAEPTIPKDEPKQETLEEVKDISYWKNNCEENYITTPISVLRYISELEKQQERSYSEEDLRYAFECATDLNPSFESFNVWFKKFKKK